MEYEKSNSNEKIEKDQPLSLFDNYFYEKTLKIIGLINHKKIVYTSTIRPEILMKKMMINHVLSMLMIHSHIKVFLNHLIFYCLEMLIFKHNKRN